MFDPNPLFYKMLVAYKQARDTGQRLIICNEGGSRSGKTWSEFDLITWICDHNRNAGLDIYILRDTLIHCRDFTQKDFIKLLQINGMYDHSKMRDYPKPYYNLFGNNIYFRGLDDESAIEGYPSDIIFVNEVLETEKSKVDGLKMRCRKLIMFDWNPKLTKHWVFELEGQPDVIFFRSNYKENKHLEKTIVDEIESYNPDNPINVQNKTANLFRWRVYGLGVRTDQEGNVFNDNELNRFELKDIDLNKALIIAYCDVADQGVDNLSFVIGALIDKKVYIIDVIYTPQNSDYYIPLIIEMFEKYNIQKAVFESNNQGLMLTKYLKMQLNERDVKKIVAMPNSQNKHSRIIIQAETNIIPNFHFLQYHSGMYKNFMDDLLSYKHDKSYKIDDAPDSLAGLSMFVNRIR